MKNYYEILEVNENASTEIINKVYKVLAKKYHPDTNLDNKEEAEKKFKEISEAYEILSNDDKRKQYDLELENFKQTNNSNSETVPLQDFIELRNYCEKLENTINSYANKFNSSQSNGYRPEPQAQQQYTQQYQSQNQTQKHNNNFDKSNVESKAYQDAMNKAYHDTYYNTLRNMGYKIRYKKTFKENLKNFITLIITAFLLWIIFKIIWDVPSLRNWFTSLFKVF